MAAGNRATETVTADGVSVTAGYAYDGLNRLLYNEPSTFAELYLSNELESYLTRYEKVVQRQESNLRDSIEKHYNPRIARQIARKFMMYDS